MKSFEITEDQLENLDAVAAVMLRDENDPRSRFYKRTLNRPRINWVKILLTALLFPLAAVAVYSLLVYARVSHGLALGISISCFLLLVLIHLRRAAICLIRIYQRFAPASIRNKCRFEPSCSEYCLQCLQKYGLIKGAWKGFDRLTRCNILDGGFDYP